MNYALCILLLIIAAMLLSKNSQMFESFENKNADLYNNQPYHLLDDIFSPPRLKESLSCVNSRSCYASDFENVLSKTGNFRQITNNYKREYPDNCSAPFQELTLNFYKVAPFS